MISPRSLRFRLTVWYFVSLLAVVAVLVVGSWFAMRASLNHSIDENLTARLGELSARFDTASVEAPDLATIVLLLGSSEGPANMDRITDEDGVVVYESSKLTVVLRGTALTGPEIDRHRGVAFREATLLGQPVVRLASADATFQQKKLHLEVAEVMRPYNHASLRFGLLLILLSGILIIPATAGGFLLSGRAIAPVSRIIRDARAIDVQDLSARLEVPASRDELQELSETLNAMLTRIQESVNRTRQFTADASHELRTPLTLISTAAEFSLHRPRSRQELEGAIRKIARESARAADLVDMLLLLARSDAEVFASASQNIDLNALSGNLQEEWITLAASRGIRMSFDNAPQACWVRGNESSLRRLFILLLDNAVKYTLPDGRISVAVSTHQRQHIITVVDTGIGIAEVDLPKIFDRFWRADKVRSPNEGGTGLGLSLAQRIVEEHNGSITVHSIVSRGSTFTVTLPVSSQWEL